MTDVEREAAVSGGDDSCGVPLSSGRDVGTKVADEDVGAASILDAKSSGVGIAGMKIFLIAKICRQKISRLEGLITVMHCKMPLVWRRCHPRMMIYFCRFLLPP